MKNKVLAAQQEDAARRLVRTALSREGFSPVPGEESGAVEAGERKVIITYQIRVTGSGSTAPVQTITMAARPEDLLAHTGGLQMDRLEFGRLAISYRGRSVTVEGRELPLTLKEFELLAYFMENKGIALSRERILNSVWNYDYFGDARTIDTHVKKLRSKMGEKGELIKTIWGMGYKLDA